jgi:FtsP/CotA-like multicopper oxidase with cupredoxin domain
MSRCSSSTILCFLLYCVLATINASPLTQSQYASAASAHPNKYILSPDFEITDKPKTRKYTFHVTESTAALDGFLRPVLAINGQIPGPLIEVCGHVFAQSVGNLTVDGTVLPFVIWLYVFQANEGDHLEITVVNQMTVGLTLHWHGIYQASTQL